MGPLTSVKVVELAAIGPAPFCAMLLADLGADVIRLDRTVPVDLGVRVSADRNLLNRGRRSVAVDLKTSAGIEIVKRLVMDADVLIEGFRPGVTERLGIGPDECLHLNPHLVYGRVTGWGQTGPLAHAAGHDIDYIALSGVLGTIGPEEGAPVPPLNLIGDYGGGGAYLALGVISAVLEARTSGRGQVVDAAMVDCAASLLTSVFSQKASGSWVGKRGSNALDGGAPWYRTYETADGKYVAIGAIEPKFYDELLRLVGIDDDSRRLQHDREAWPRLREQFARAFKGKTRAEWCAILEGSDACFAPVLDLDEAPSHPHARARRTFIEVDGVVQPAPAPRFSRTSPQVRSSPPQPGQHTDAVLASVGYTAAECARFRAEGVVR